MVATAGFQYKESDACDVCKINKAVVALCDHCHRRLCPTCVQRRYDGFRIVETSCADCRSELFIG
jgi:hypothetical protein